MSKKGFRVVLTHSPCSDSFVVTGPDRDDLYRDDFGNWWHEGQLTFLDREGVPEGENLKLRGNVKAPLDKVPLELLYGVARVLDYGDRKYEPGNWRKAAADGRQAVRDYVAACLRHLSEVQNGAHRVDEESGLPHLDHAITSLLIARYVAQNADLLEQDPGRGAEPS